MWETIKTPAYVVDEKKLRENLECLHRVEEETGCHILLAQKAFSMFRVYPLIGSYLSGTTASGLYEARLGYEEMKKENHVFAPAYKTEDMKELVTICDHIIFNSFAQFEKHKEIISEYNNSQRENGNRVSIGMRVNPEFSVCTRFTSWCSARKISRNTSKRNRRTSYAYALRAGF
jgi:carboxynorspermidine decarboxylase